MLSLKVCVVMVVCVTANMAQPNSLSDVKCSSQTSAAHITLNTLRSVNGNWVTKVDLERGGARGKMDVSKTEPWSVDVDSNTRTCEGAESILHVALTITAPLPKLSSDYELFPGLGYYKFHTDVTTWPLARQKCAEEGAHLVIINSEMEADVLVKLFVRHPTIAGADSVNYAWIGVQRKLGEYFTIFGDALNTTGFTRWHTGEPHNGASDDCLLITKSSGGLADVHCPWKVAFICEHEL